MTSELSPISAQLMLLTVCALAVYVAARWAILDWRDERKRRERAGKVRPRLWEGR